MPLRVQPDLGNFPSGEKALESYLSREVHPVLKATRRAVNELVDVSPHPWIDDTTGDTEKDVAEIEINEDELVTIEIDVKGSAGAGDWVFVRQRKSYERSGGAIALVLTEMDEAPVYAGDNSSLTTATAAVTFTQGETKVKVSVTGEAGTPIHWTVTITKALALRRTEKT